MINIPTELLRTLIAVVDLRSFTKAAQMLGVTQPAVSAQIKRLHQLLDCELLDKSAPGVSLTPSGEMVTVYARRMLSLNDQIAEMAVPRVSALTIRIGVPGDFGALMLPPLLADFQARYPGTRFSVRGEHFDVMSRDLRNGELDLMIGMSESGIVLDARHHWMEPLVWVRDPAFNPDPALPLPFITHGEICAIHRATVTALNRAQRAFSVVFVGLSEASIAAAIRDGLGVGAVPMSRVDRMGLTPWLNAPLPPLPGVHCGLYLGETGPRPMLEELADALAQTLHSMPRRASIAAIS
jgi:DNA-binding transcriptional LysR family regulator